MRTDFTCPVCEREHIAPPHKVCVSCYERLKRDEVHDRAYYEEAWKGVRETPEERKKPSKRL
jgi:hypothetical protein